MALDKSYGAINARKNDMMNSNTKASVLITKA